MTSDVHIVTVAGRAWLNANDRIHWAQRAALTDSWRNLTRLAARQAELPRFESRVRIDAICLFPRDDRTRDPANWQPTAKAIVDGLTDTRVKVGRHRVTVAGWLADDDRRHVAGPYMDIRIQPGVRRPTVELHITECGDEL